VFVVLQTASFSKQHNAWIVILMLLPYQNTNFNVPVTPKH